MNRSAFTGGHIKYQVAVISFMKPHLDQFQSDHEEEYREVFGNILFDADKPRTVNVPLSPLDILYAKIWIGFSEINESYEIVHDIRNYMRRFPAKSLNLSRVRFLRYHITNYLNEVYILRERLKAYLKVIQRAYRKDTRLDGMSKRFSLLTPLISSFDGIVSVRGEHVHRVRYTDKDLDRLGLLELLATHGSTGLSTMLYKSAIREIRKKWLKVIDSNNEVIDQVFDEYFGILYQIVFSEDGQVIVPFSVS